MKVILAITGASGSIYGKLLLDRLLACEQVSQTAVIMSRCGSEVSRHEQTVFNLAHPKVRLCNNDDMFDAVASGSSGYDAMAVAPCSMGTAGRIAHGLSSDLIGRAADVMLKERRPLAIVPRELPYSTVHLRNLTTLSECGATVIPASPSFYSHPGNIEELCLTVVDRIIPALGIRYSGFRWDERG